MYQAILFDLDGTLTDSGPGITRSVAYALEKMGKPEENLENLRVFVGPPLLEMFQSYSGFTEEEAREAVAFYRERFVPIGMFENSVYPGIPEVLEALKNKGFRLAIASSKPEPFIHQILEHFGIKDYFEVIVGPTLGEQGTTKKECVEEALRRLDLLDRRDQVLMVGDTHYDVEGAREMGVDCLAVTYGYEDPEVLKQSHPLALADSPGEILDFFS